MSNRKPMSEEHKAKIAAALKGRTLSEETKAKISAALTGRKQSEETKAKISAALMGNTNATGGVQHDAEEGDAGTETAD